MKENEPIEVTPDELAKYMREETDIPAEKVAGTGKVKKRTRKPRKRKADVEESQDTDAKSRLKRDGVAIDGSEEDGNIRASFTADETFAVDEGRQVMQDLYASVGPNTIPVTDDDKMDFLLAAMDDKPVELDVTVLNGIHVRVRSLTPYELDLAADAVVQYAKRNPDSAAILINAHLQQYRMAMQVVAFNGKATSYIKYECGSGPRGEHLEDLMEYTERYMTNVNGPRYAAMIKAVNVFEHKLSVLDGALLNQDFWHPVSAASS